MSWLKNKVPTQCFSHRNTVVVLSGHRAQLQGKLALGSVSGDGHKALEGWVIPYASTIISFCNPFQPLSLGLLDPVPGRATGYDEIT